MINYCSVVLNVCKLQNCLPCFSNVVSTRLFASFIARRKAILPNDQKSPNSFNLFVKENIRDIPNILPKERLKVLAVKWRNLSDNEKERYKEESKKIRAQTNEIFNDSSTIDKDRMIQEYKNKQSERQKKHRRLTLRKFRQETNYPIRPPNIWSMYIKDIAEKENKNIVEASKNVSEKYQKLSDEEKLQYKEKYSQKLLLRKAELEKWKEDYGEEYSELKKSVSIKKLQSTSSQIKDQKAKKKGSARTGLCKRLKKASDEKNAKIDS